MPLTKEISLWSLFPIVFSTKDFECSLLIFSRVIIWFRTIEASLINTEKKNAESKRVESEDGSLTFRNPFEGVSNGFCNRLKGFAVATEAFVCRWKDFGLFAAIGQRVTGRNRVHDQETCALDQRQLKPMLWLQSCVFLSLLCITASFETISSLAENKMNSNFQHFKVSLRQTRAKI